MTRSHARILSTWMALRWVRQAEEALSPRLPIPATRWLKSMVLCPCAWALAFCLQRRVSEGQHRVQARKAVAQTLTEDRLPARKARPLFVSAVIPETRACPTCVWSRRGEEKATEKEGTGWKEWLAVRRHMRASAALVMR